MGSLQLCTPVGSIISVTMQNLMLASCLAVATSASYLSAPSGLATWPSVGGYGYGSTCYGCHGFSIGKRSAEPSYGGAVLSGEQEQRARSRAGFRIRDQSAPPRIRWILPVPHSVPLRIRQEECWRFLRRLSDSSEPQQPVRTPAVLRIRHQPGSPQRSVCPTDLQTAFRSQLWRLRLPLLGGVHTVSAKCATWSKYTNC